MQTRVGPRDLERAAARIADESGLDAVTMTSVAHALSVRTPSLYGHVADRAALLDRLSVHALALLANELGEVLAGRSRRDALEAFARAHRRTVQESPGLWDALQRPLDAATAAASAGPRIGALATAVLRGYDVPGEDLVHAVRLLGATVNGFLSLERSAAFSHSAPDPEASWNRMIDALDVLFKGWPAAQGGLTT